MGTRLFGFTAYHPQTDGISKRTNPMVEINIRFFTTNYPEINFVLALFFLQRDSRIYLNAITGLSINEFSYGFKMRETFSSFTESEIYYDLPAQRFEYRQKNSGRFCIY